MNRISFLSSTLCLTLLSLGSGCGQSLQIPIPLESPTQEIDATSQVLAFESRLCADAQSDDCLVVQALDYSDDENVSNPPSIPEEIPTEVTLVDPNTGTPLIDPDTGEPRVVNVEEWVNQSGFKDNLDLSQSLNIDLSEKLAEKGINTDSVIDAVTVNSFGVEYVENSLTFSGVELDLYVSVGAVENASDSAQLIADGLVEKVGTVPAQDAQSVGLAPIAFVSGGNALLNEALKAATFTLVIAAQPGSSLVLAQGQNANTLKKPFGLAEVSVKDELVYTVSTKGLVDL